MKIVKKVEQMQPLKTVYRQRVVSFSEIDELLETYTNLHYYKILFNATPNMGVFKALKKDP